MQNPFLVLARIILCSSLIIPLLTGNLSASLTAHFQLPSGGKANLVFKHSQLFEGEWVNVPSPTPDTLLSCDFTDPDNGWAVGMGVFQWDGEQWNQVLKKEWPPYYSVKMLSETDGWIVGAEGAILHWDGKRWSPFDSPTEFNLYDLSFTSPNRGWAVGGDPDFLALPGQWKPDRILIEWDGKEWKEAPFPRDELVNLELRKITMLTPDNGWALGDDGEYHWNGKTWEKYQIGKEGSTNTYLSISALSSDDIWMAGYDFSTTFKDPQQNPGVIYHWNGAEWREIFRSNNYPLLSIHMVAPDFGWAVGGDNSTFRGGSTILRWDGKTWQEVYSPTNLPLQYVFALSKMDGWILAGGFNPNAGYEGAIFRYVIETVPTLSPRLTNVTQLPPTIEAISTIQPRTSTPTRAVAIQKEREQPKILTLAAGLLAAVLLILLMVYRIKMAKAD